MTTTPGPAALRSMSATTRDLPPGTDDEPALLAWLAQMRETAPVWRDRYGLHHVFRHDDVVAVTSDPATFSSDFSVVMPDTAGLGRGMLTRVDPPEHKALRGLVSASFTPKRVAGLEPRIRELTRGMLDTADETSSTWSTRSPSRCR